MATVSFNEFMKRSGTPSPEKVTSIGINQPPMVSKPETPAPVQPEKPGIKGYVKNVAEDFKQRGEKVVETIKKAKTGEMNPISAGLQTVGQIAGGAGDIVTEAIKPGLEKSINEISDKPAVQKIAETKPAEEITKGASDIKAKYDQFKEKHPTAAGDLEAAFNIGSLLLGEGEGSAAKAAVPKVASAAEKAVVPAAEVASKAAVPTTEAAANPIGMMSTKLYELGIGRNTAEAERILQYRADKVLGKNVKAPMTRATTAQEFGLAGRQTDIGVQAKVAGKNLYNKKILPALKGSDKIITKEELFKPLEEKINATVDPSRKADLKDAYDALTEEYANEKDWTLENAQKLKQGIDTYTQDKVFRGKPIASSYNEMRHMLADTIRSKTYEGLKDMNIKRDYLNYGNLIELEKLGIKGITDTQLKAGFGSFVSGLVDKAVTPVATYSGKALYKVAGTPITFTAPEGIKSLGEYLQSQGYDMGNGGFAKNPFARYDYKTIAKEIDNTDKNILTEFSDNFHAGKKNTTILKKKVQDMLDFYGTPGRFGKDADVAKDVNNILDAERQVAQKK